MSGICGVVGHDDRRWPRRALAEVEDVLAPLGPDGGGGWDGVAGRCGVAVAAVLRHRTPTDLADIQPVTSDDGMVVVVADVRLDDRAGLGRAIGVQGWTSWPDSRLILAAYQRWGRNCLDRMVGVYAFAVVDRRRGGVLLARDHLGIRPLVLHQGKTRTAFASNALSLTAFEGVGHRLDERRAGEFLALTTASERTFVEGVRWLPPGHAAWIDAGGSRQWRWWNPDPSEIVDLGSPRAHAEMLRSTFDEAVRSQLRTPTRVGAQLSGGLDSPSVAATAAQLLAPGLLPTYTSVPPAVWHGETEPGWDADESPLVRDLATLHANIRPTFVDVGGVPLFDGRYERYWELGAGPPRNPCNVMWIDAIAEAARADGVGALLTGTTGNLAFSADGPDWLWTLLRAGQLRRLVHETTAWSRRNDVSWVRTLRHNLISPVVPPALRSLRRRRTAGGDPVHAWLAATAVRPEAVEIEGLIAGHPRLNPDHNVRYRLALWAAAAEFGGQADTGAAMEAYWGLDVRDPTADRRVWEVALTQPEWARRHSGVTRAVAREAMAERLPASIGSRSRRGEQLPDWLDRLTEARSEVRASIDAMFDHPMSRRLIDVERLDRLERAWPARSRSADSSVSESYRQAMLRAVVTSRYLRWFERGAVRCTAVGPSPDRHGNLHPMAVLLPWLVMLRHGLRACRRRDADALRAGWWALRAGRRVHRQLQHVGPVAVALPTVPSVESDAGRRCERVVQSMLDWRHSTCLERALVSQAWAKALGHPIDLVIGVSAPGDVFTAHAWLEGEPVDSRYVELWRLPPQATAPDDRRR